MNQGFSLTEVLVSLILITGTSSLLIKQQWQVSHFLTQTQLRAYALSQLDNTVERLYAGQTSSILPEPFHLRFIKTQEAMNVEIFWQIFSSAKPTRFILKRKLVAI